MESRHGALECGWGLITIAILKGMACGENRSIILDGGETCDL